MGKDHTSRALVSDSIDFQTNKGTMGAPETIRETPITPLKIDDKQSKTVNQSQTKK